MIYLLTAIGISPGGRSTVHIYTQTIHRMIQNKQYVIIIIIIIIVIIIILSFYAGYLQLYGARDGVVIKALRYKPAGRRFDSRCCHWNFSVT